VAWVHSEAGDPTLTRGGASLRVACLTQDGWITQAPGADLATVDALAAREENGALAVYYTKSSDGSEDPATRELYRFAAGSEERLTENAVADTKPAVADGILTWYQSGGVQVAGELVPTGLAGDTYQYIPGTQGQGVDALLYTVHTPAQEGGLPSSSLYAIFQDGSGWGSPILLTQQEGYLYSFHGAYRPDGALLVAVNQWDESGEIPQANLICYELLPRCDLAALQVSYDPYTLIPGGTLEMDVTFANQGTSTVPVARVQVYHGEQLLATGYYPQALLSGQQAHLTISCPLEEGQMPEELTVAVAPMGFADSNSADNTVSCPLAGQDLSVEEVRADPAGAGTSVTVLLANRGSAPVEEAALTLRLGGPDGEILATQPVAGLEGRGAQVFNLTLDQALPQGSVLYADAAPLAGENLLGNNQGFGVVGKAPTSGLALTGTAEQSGDITTVSFAVDNSAERTQSVLLVAAAYDGTGRVLDLQTEKLPLDAWSYRQGQLTLNAPGCREVRLYLLDEETLVPLCPAQVL
jgi:hypothetical protein